MLQPQQNRAIRFTLYRVLLMTSALGLGTILGACSSINPDEELPMICLTKPQPGPCRASLVRFYYDYRDNRCKAFFYGGCNGQVPFETMRECQRLCEARHP